MRPSKIVQTFLWKACVDSFVRRIQLGPCFFQYLDPHFVLYTVRESRPLTVAWHKIVDDDLFPFSLVKNFAREEPSLVNLRC